MTAVQQLTSRLENLPEEKREAIARAILEEWDAQDWDRQIEEDAREGKLNFLITELNDDLKAGRARPV